MKDFTNEKRVRAVDLDDGSSQLREMELRTGECQFTAAGLTKIWHTLLPSVRPRRLLIGLIFQAILMAAR